LETQPKQFFPGLIKYPLPKALMTISTSPLEPTSYILASKEPGWRVAMNTKFTDILKNYSRPFVLHDYSLFYFVFSVVNYIHILSNFTPNKN
jgi:hypothetical protein